MNIDFKLIGWMNTIKESGVLITEDEAQLLMQLSKRKDCRIAKEQVRMIAQNSGLTIFDDEIF